jgi:putative spermidine/putrescine transport system ATP-binding protein
MTALALPGARDPGGSSPRGGREPLKELRLKRVARRFGELEALAGLDLTIEGGEFVALLGPSGCGKTTALNCLAGLLPLSAGTIWLDGERIDQLSPERRGFGMVFQNYALFPHLSVTRNVGFGLDMRGIGKSERGERVQRALQLVGLEAHAAKFPAQLSGGQQQRVAIARAVIVEPRLLLMDEPLSNLDAKLRLEMRTEIRRLHQDLGLTTVYVTHDQEEALSLADRLVLLRDGRVEQVGAPEEIYGQPVSAYAASFMGYRNMLELTVEATHGNEVTVADSDTQLRGVDRRRRGGGRGGRAIAAIRPEDFTVGRGGVNALRARVAVVEYRGRGLAVEALMAGERGLHIVTDQRLVPGDEVALTVAPERVLIFDAEDAESAEGANGNS